MTNRDKVRSVALESLRNLTCQCPECRTTRAMFRLYLAVLEGDTEGVEAALEEFEGAALS